MRNSIITAIFFLLAGLGIGYGMNELGGTNPTDNTSKADPDKPLYWVAPMDANYRRDKPGKSPMGMDLVPVYPGDETGGNSDALTLDASVINNIGVRTTTALKGTLPREIDTVGFITHDETLTSHVHVRATGWVEKLNFKAVGEHINKGDILFELYSPDLVNAQTEYLQALRLKQQSLISASEERLIALGMMPAQIASLKASKKVMQGLPIIAHNDGVIMNINIGEGMYITPGTTVFSLADLSNIWVKVDVFEAQSSWLEKGQTAQMTLPFMPGEKWEGTIDYVYPFVDPKSRTVQARLSFSNTDGRLKPNMYGEVQLAGTPLDDVITIPREALIRTGKIDRVILAMDGGKFRPAEVIAGQESGNLVEIKEGLAAGEKIVNSGQFLIDSEASTNSAYLRLLGAGHDEMQTSHLVLGTINSFEEDGLINITHGPIETLKMPGMTMNFRAGDTINLEGLSVGDQINFEIIQGDDGWYVITKIKTN